MSLRCRTWYNATHKVNCFQVSIPRVNPKIKIKFYLRKFFRRYWIKTYFTITSLWKV